MCRSAGPRRARCDETPIEIRDLRHDDANGIAPGSRAADYRPRWLNQAGDFTVDARGSPQAPGSLPVAFLDLPAGFMAGRAASCTPAQFIGIVVGLAINRTGTAINLTGLQQSGLAFA
jgi:hypothetical protein